MRNKMQYVSSTPRAPASSEMFKDKYEKEKMLLSFRFIILRDQRFVCILILRSAEPEITQLRDD